jgi:FG-GAP-like repeat
LKRLVVAAALLHLLSSCTNFPIIEADVCGNEVLEDQEDCDTLVDEKAGFVCRPPGETNACHFDCSESPGRERGVCPDGMGCSPEGICRYYTGGFEAPTLITSDPSSWVSAADFDGDGHWDVLSSEPEDQLQQARFRVHYFDSDTRPTETRVFPRATTRPLARDLDGDGAHDLVFSNFRIGLLPGRPDRGFLPATFSSYVSEAAELLAVSVTDSFVGGEGAPGLVVFSTLGDETTMSVLVDAQRLVTLQALARPLTDLVAPPVAADFVTSRDSPCAEVVLGYRGESSVQVLDLCELAPEPVDVEILWRSQAGRQDVHLPAGKTLQGAPVAADVDGDGHLDLLLNDAQNTYVAYGDGARLQGEATPLLLPRAGASEPFTLPRLLAAGDVTGDGAADFVFPLGVIGSRKSEVDGRTVYQKTFANSALPWSTAVIGDLNANGHADVVAATEGADGLSFVNGSSDPSAIGARITTHGPVRALTMGDFDGDLVKDLAFVEGGPTDGSGLLTLSYGVRDQLPLEAVRVAEVGVVQQLGRMRAFGVDDVFTTSSRRVAGKHRGTFTLFSGDASRLPFAPYTLVSFGEANASPDQVALALILGRFTRADQDDVLSLGFDEAAPWSQWLLPDLVAGNERPRVLESGKPTTPTTPTNEVLGGEQLRVAGVAADLDGSGLDEALWLMPGAEGVCTLLVYSVDGAQRAATLQSQLRLDEPCGAPQLAAVDLNTDERPDLLMLVGHDADSPRRLQILWNDGGGGFTLDDRSFVTPPTDEDVRAFSVFPTAGVKLALVTATTAFTATTRSDSRKWVVSPVIGADEFQDARSVVVTDPNGDGFPDMVVADASGLWLSKAELR